MTESALPMRRLDSADPAFETQVGELLARGAGADPLVEARVKEIIAAVRARGDDALLEYTASLDGRELAGVGDIVVSAAEMRAARESLEDRQIECLREAADRIRRYHERQRRASWSYEEADGTVLGQEVRALDRVGLYAPGGKAAYPSSVLMGAIPARVAGVGEIIMAVPAPGGKLNALVLAAASLAGIDQVFSVGGAQAIAALAYGTATVPAVDKIVGPGNTYVATAKRLVFGSVGIDMVAGPSEILIVCDGRTPARWIAMDLFSQAEHDEDARAILISPDGAFLDAVEASIGALLPGMERRAIIARSLRSHGALIKVGGLDEAIALVNRIAPEHLELSVDEPRRWLARVRHAGAVFMGRYTAEALGDYCAGPNHVLPTSRTARFSSPLGVYDFQKRCSVIECTASGARRLGALAETFAREEGLTAHARSARMRFDAEVGQCDD